MKKLVKMWRGNPLVEGGIGCLIVTFRAWTISALIASFSVILLIFIFVTLFITGNIRY